jgi:hypothetical protein
MLRLLTATLCAALLTTSAGASASARSDLGYTSKQVYSGALRYLRIDLDYEITEKDPDAAYLLFRYTPQGQRQTRFGSFEIVPTSEGVRLVVTLPKMPSYHEQVLRDGLVRKLREDYGAPSPKSPPEEPGRDGDHDDEDDDPAKLPEKPDSDASSD